MFDICPKSWESLDKPPRLRRLTEKEWGVIRAVSFPKTAFTPNLANELITIYAKAVGYETRDQVYNCMKTVGFWDYETWQPSTSEEVIDYKAINCDWRIGSPDWDSTKLIITENDTERTELRAGISPNTPYDHEGYSNRDIDAQLYFAEMAAGYLALRQSCATQPEIA